MVFTNFDFIFLFLPLFIIIYSLIRDAKIKNLFLFVFSLFFYAWGEPIKVGLLVVMIGLTYCSGFVLERNRNKILLFILILLTASPLLFYKYSAFVLTNVNKMLHLSFEIKPLSSPLGISFYTFMCISYIADVYMKRTNAEKNLINLGAYISFFPSVSSGPINRYGDIKEQLNNSEFDINNVENGLRRFVVGLGKKIIIANNVGMVADAAFNSDLYWLPLNLAWIGAVAYMVQIYFDFSGYSDMAIGISEMMGIKLKENFDSPYVSKSATEFWRRWHISLGSWFRDYVYIPLGGNRVSTFRWIINIFVVWALTGFWHGASFINIGWGLYFGILLILEKKFIIRIIEKNDFISHLYALLVILFGWVIFRSYSVSGFIRYAISMIDIRNIGTVRDLVSVNALVNIIYVLIGIVLLLPPVKKFFMNVKDKHPVIYDVLLIMVFVLVIYFLENSTYSPFLYFNF